MTTRRAQSAAPPRAATSRWRGMLCRLVRACAGCVAVHGGGARSPVCCCSVPMMGIGLSKNETVLWHAFWYRLVASQSGLGLCLSLHVV